MTHDAFGSTWFNWEGMRLLQEERGSVVATHIYEPGSYAPLARIDLQPDLLAGAQDPDNPPPVNTNVYYFHTNINGAPEEMTNRQGTLVWRARYAVWGNTIAEEWHPQHRPNTSGLSATNPLPQNLRMQGQYYDAETGLSYNTFRYYDADVGRFISQDPIGLAGGMNPYKYAPNPIAWIDPWGWAAGTCAPAPRPASGPLDWSRVNPHTGETAIDHVMRHGNDIPNRTVPHGVFADDPIATTNKAWDKAVNSGMMPAVGPNGNWVYDVPHPDAGLQGGIPGNAAGNPIMNIVRIVTSPGSNQVITSFPK